MNFVDDVNLEPSPAGPHASVLPQLADFVDAAIAGAVDFQDIDVFAPADAHADVALVARMGRGAVHAVERLGENPRGRGLAHPTGAREQVSVSDPVRFDGAG